MLGMYVCITPLVNIMSKETGYLGYLHRVTDG